MEGAAAALGGQIAAMSRLSRLDRLAGELAVARMPPDPAADALTRRVSQFDCPVRVLSLGARTT